MKIHLLVILGCSLALQILADPKFEGSSKPYPRNSDLLTIEEILNGSLRPTTDTIDSIFSLYDNTYTWETSSKTTIKLWEGTGMWPGSYPLALQVYHKDKLVNARKLDFPPGSKMKDIVAFNHFGMFVINLTCEHRHEDYQSTCAFSVLTVGSRIVNGGPVISSAELERKRAASKIYKAIENAAVNR